MNFSAFMKSLRTQLNVVTAKELYEALGGEEELGVSLRQFQHIDTGTSAPSGKLLATLFSKVPVTDRKTIVLAYFNSLLGGEANAEKLIKYLDLYLLPALESDAKSLWESNKKLMMYSEDQLDYLSANPDALRLHRRILLLGSIELSAVTLSKKKLEELNRLELIEIRGKGKDREIYPSRNLYRIPHYENSSPRVVSSATDYILKQVDVYISREGSSQQELGYAFQMVTPAAAERIMDQLKAFKRWVQSLASNDTGPNLRPLLFVGFAKELENREI